MTHAYYVNSIISGFSASSCTWTTGPATDTRLYVVDGRLDKRYVLSSVASTANVVIDFGTSTSVKSFAVLNSNISEASGTPTLLVESDDNAGFSSPTTRKAATTLNLVAPNNKDHALVFTAAAERYWRLTWTWTGSFALKVGEIVAATTVTTLGRTSIFGSGESEEYKNSRVEMANGDVRSHFISGPIPSRSLNFDALSAADREELFIMHRATRGGALPILWIDDVVESTSAGTAASQRCIYGRTQPTLGWTQDDFAIYGVSGIEIRGMTREMGA